MHFLILFPLFFTIFNWINCSLTAEEFKREFELYATFQPKIVQLAADYHQRGYYSIEKWLENTFLKGVQMEKLQEAPRLFDAKNCLFDKLYKYFSRRNRVMPYYLDPVQLNRYFKASFLLEVGNKLATNDHGSPTPGDMIDTLKDILELEASIETIFITPNDKLDNLYAKAVHMMYKNEAPPSLLLLEHSRRTVEVFLEKNPELSFGKGLKKKLRKMEDIEGKMLKIEKIDSEATIDLFVLLAEEYMSLSYRTDSILSNNDYSCSDFECKSKTDRMIDSQNNC